VEKHFSSDALATIAVLHHKHMKLFQTLTPHVIA